MIIIVILGSTRQCVCVLQGRGLCKGGHVNGLMGVFRSPDQSSIFVDVATQLPRGFISLRLRVLHPESSYPNHLS